MGCEARFDLDGVLDVAVYVDTCINFAKTPLIKLPLDAVLTAHYLMGRSNGILSQSSDLQDQNS